MTRLGRKRIPASTAADPKAATPTATDPTAAALAAAAPTVLAPMVPATPALDQASPDGYASNCW